MHEIIQMNFFYTFQHILGFLRNYLKIMKHLWKLKLIEMLINISRELSVNALTLILSGLKL